MSDLNTAIQWIRQGRKTEAQSLLQTLIKADPKNIQAWFWYVEACATTAQRIQALEMCLKINPGNPQVMQALQQFRSQVREVPTMPPPAPLPAYQPVEPIPAKEDDLYDYDSYRSPYVEEEKSSVMSALDAEYESFKIKPEARSSQKAWESDNSQYTDNSMLSKSKKPLRSYSTLDVWATVLTAQDEKSYADILKDPEMGLGRAFTWTAISGIVAALAVPLQLMFNPQIVQLLDMPEFQNAFGSIESASAMLIITGIAVIISPIGSVINLALGGGLMHLIAMAFGGGGNYTRTVYAVAAFLAPMTIITSLLAAIPLIGQCLTFPLGIYNLVLNVRALKAAHDLSNGAAIGVIFAPLILVFVFACLVAVATGMSLPS